MRIGSLNRKITLQRNAQTQDPASGAMLDGWVDVASVWANIRFLGGIESIKSDAPVSVARASIRIRYRTDLGASMRVVHGLTVFDVKSVLPDEQGREHVDLVCETGANDG